MFSRPKEINNSKETFFCLERNMFHFLSCDTSLQKIVLLFLGFMLREIWFYFTVALFLLLLSEVLYIKRNLCIFVESRGFPENFCRSKLTNA